MKKVLVIAIFSLFIVSTAKAENLPWLSVQMQGVVKADVPIKNTHPLFKDKLFVQTQMTIFWVPQDDISMMFLYVGPKWKINDWFWFSVPVAYVGNWLDKEDAFDFGVWAGIGKGQLSLFLESEGVVNSYGIDYYGYYSADYAPLKWLNGGVHGEQLNKLMTFGPHIGVSRTFWGMGASLEVQYYVGLQEAVRGHTLRFVLSLSVK